MFSRYASAISTSTIMTLGLIYIMHTLIEIQPGVLAEPRERTILVFRPVREDTPTRTHEERIRREELVETIVPPTTRPEYTNTDTINVPVPTEQPPTGSVPTTFSLTDGPLVTMYNVQPIYPVRALERGIEGYVVVEFDVDANGRAMNIRVVESTDSIFHKAAIRAAERIKFKARVIDGTAVATTNVRKLFRFDIEDE